MSSLEDLIAKARMLHSEGHNPSQIADELNLSMETVTWLLTQQKGAEAPRDVAINWTPVSSHADMLRDISVLMLKQFFYAQEENRPGREVAEMHFLLPLKDLYLLRCSIFQYLGFS